MSTSIYPLEGLFTSGILTKQSAHKRETSKTVAWKTCQKNNRSNWGHGRWVGLFPRQPASLPDFSFPILSPSWHQCTLSPHGLPGAGEIKVMDWGLAAGPRPRCSQPLILIRALAVTVQAPSPTPRATLLTMGCHLITWVNINVWRKEYVLSSEI